MNNLELLETLTTPYVLLDASEGIFTIQGRSIPENVIDFFQPILNWIDDYAQSPMPRTVLHFKFEYFNTSSSKRIFDIMKKVELMHVNTGKSVEINWYYEEDDEDIFFAGSDYKALISKIDFNLVEQ